MHKMGAMTIMSKYEPLWQYVKNCGETELTLTFAQVQQIVGFPIDHSFLRHKKELPAYGYTVAKIYMQAGLVHFVKLG